MKMAENNGWKEFGGLVSKLEGNSELLGRENIIILIAVERVGGKG